MNRRLQDAYDAGDPTAEAEVDRRIDEAVEADQLRRHEKRQRIERACQGQGPHDLDCWCVECGTCFNHCRPDCFLS